jgi:flagellar protein FliL
MMTLQKCLYSLFAILFLALSWQVNAADKEGAAKAIYYAMDPPFVVNLNEGPRMHFMQITVQLMSHDPAVIAAVEANQPPLRDALIMLLSHQTGETMRGVMGREDVRKQALTDVRKVLAEVAGVKKGLDAVYFTDFVIQ